MTKKETFTSTNTVSNRYNADDTTMIAIISNSSELQHLTPLIESNSNTGVKLGFIALNIEVYQELVGMGLDCKMSTDCGLTKANVEDEVLHWFRTFPNTMVSDGNNIKELLRYDGISIWWLVDETIFLGEYVLGTNVKNIMKQTVVFQHLIDEESPGKIWCTMQNRMIWKTVLAISQQRGITLLPLTRNHSGLSEIRDRLSQGSRALIHVCYHWAIMLVRKIRWALLGGSRSYKSECSRSRILMFSGDNWRNVHNLKTGELQKGDMYFDPVIDVLVEHNHTVVFVDSPTTKETKWHAGTLREKRRQNRMVYRPFESYMKLSDIPRAFRTARKLHKHYEFLSDRAFRESMNWRGIPLSDIVKKSLDFAFSTPNLMRVLAMYEMTRRMVETENPDGVLMCGEFPAERPIIAAAKPKGVPTLFFQHGTYSPYMLHYNHNDDDISSVGDCSAPYCPVPDKFVFYSDFDKRNLVERGRFSEDDVFIVGQPRYDIISRAPRDFLQRRYLRAVAFRSPEKTGPLDYRNECFVIRRKRKEYNCYL